VAVHDLACLLAFVTDATLGLTDPTSTADSHPDEGAGGECRALDSQSGDGGDGGGGDRSQEGSTGTSAAAASGAERPGRRGGVGYMGQAGDEDAVAAILDSWVPLLKVVED
jgi:hypothetical protein